jgi:serine/threonine protein phosphatase PrpC
MAQKTICPKCKREASAKAQFCPHCGSRLNAPSPGKGGAARAHLDLSTQKMPENYIGAYRVVDVWRKEDNIYLVEAGQGAGGAGNRFFAIEETRARSPEQLNQLHALARLGNLAAVRDQVADKRGNPFLIVDYVEGTPLDQLPVPLGAERAVRVALQLTQVLGYLHEHNLTAATTARPGKKTDRLKQFQKSLLLDAQDRLFLFDYTAWMPMPQDQKQKLKCIQSDLELVVRTLIPLSTKDALGRLFGKVKDGSSQLTDLAKSVLRNPPTSAKHLAALISQILPSQPPPAKTIPLVPMQSTRTARLEDMAAKTAKLSDKLPCGGQTDKGIVRDHNEDNLLIQPIDSTSGIFVVADGMGGHAAGEVASRMAIAEIHQGATDEWAQIQQSPSVENVRGYLYKWIKSANEKIHAAAQAQRNNMGTTITAALILDHQVFVANVGDSRTYLFRDGELYQLTRDHSLVASLVQAGLLEADAIYDHPQRNEIFRSLGAQKDVNADVFEPVPLVGGDRVVLCSDGLWEMVRAPQLKEILAHYRDPQAACAELVRAANAKGGEDNITVIVVDIPF